MCNVTNVFGPYIYRWPSEWASKRSRVEFFMNSSHLFTSQISVSRRRYYSHLPVAIFSIFTWHNRYFVLFLSSFHIPFVELIRHFSIWLMLNLQPKSIPKNVITLNLSSRKFIISMFDVVAVVIAMVMRWTKRLKSKCKRDATHNFFMCTS